METERYDKDGANICNPAEELDRTQSQVLRSSGLPSPDCSCTPCSARRLTPTRRDRYEVQQAALEYAGLI